jgi:hypothetical protein
LRILSWNNIKSEKENGLGKRKMKRSYKKWWRLYYSTVGRVVFNAVILVPIIQILSLWKDGWKIPYMMEAEELPDYRTYIE